MLFAIFEILLIIYWRIVLKGLALFCALFLSGLCLSDTYAQSVPEPIRLKPERLSSDLWDYYIDQVIDERAEGQTLANVVYSGTDFKPRNYSAEISAKVLRDFLRSGFPASTSARAINIRILECKIRETNQGNYVSGQVVLKLQFELQKNWRVLPLTSYGTSLNYRRSISKPEFVENSLRSVLRNSLNFIQEWVKKESNTNVALAKSIALSFSDYHTSDADTVYYQKSRPLSFDDFTARPPQNSRFHAAIFPTFGYDMRREYRDGIIHVHIDLKVYMVKSASWALHTVKNSYSLNHEQRHFDLVKLIAEQFKSKLASEYLNPDNYEGLINVEYLEFYRKMNQLQEKYDEETSHGTNRLVQSSWNQRIDMELSKYLNREGI